MVTRKYFRWMDEPKKRGGKREGAGRKPVKEKAVGVTIYIPPSIIKAIGGKSETQEIMKVAVLNAYNKKKKK